MPKLDIDFGTAARNLEAQRLYKRKHVDCKPDNNCPLSFMKVWPP
jgi:hypothetical protein